jgi:RNase adapter protein RapZ
MSRRTIRDEDGPMSRRPTRDTVSVSTNGRRPSSLVDFVIISGLSGAGKSSAMNVFEDAGYFCVDNLPAEMIRSLAELFRHPGSKVERAAVVSDSRGGEYLAALAGVIDELDEAGVVHRVLFLEADEQTLLSRYKETRRRHPLVPHGNVVDGIRRETELMAPVRQRADTCIDTSGLSATGLRRKVADELLEREAPRRLAVTFTSFGHKYGPPRDPDLAFDVRFLPNPHYEADLRPLTGFDQRIVDYVGRDGRLQEFYDHIVPLLEYLLPQYIAEGKAHLVVAIGCTGGRHRSVAIAEHLAAAFRDRDEYFVEVQHRDVDRLPLRRAG